MLVEPSFLGFVMYLLCPQITIWCNVSNEFRPMRILFSEPIKRKTRRGKFLTDDYEHLQRCNGEGLLRPRPPGIWTLKIPDLGDPREEFPGESNLRRFRGSPDPGVYSKKQKRE